MVKRKKQIFIMFFCILFVSLLWWLCWQYCPFVFQENDDIYLKRLASGAETGTPENKLFFIGIILGTVIRGFYRMNIEVPWYSYIMLCCLFISAITALFIVLDNVEGKWGRCICLIIYAGFFYVFLVPQIINIQFTVISSYMCGIGILLFCLANDRKSYYIASFLFAFLSLQIRKECIFMALPFALIIWIAKFIYTKKRVVLLIWGVAGGIILISSLLLENLVYKGAEWEKFTDFSVKRSELYDYGGIPEYEKCKDLYEGLGISEEERNIVSDYNLIFADSIESSDLEELAKLHDRSSIKEVFSIAVEKSFCGNRALTGIIALFYLADLFLLVIPLNNRKLKIRMFMEIFSIKVISFGLWMYVVEKGRYPDRIMVSLYFLECICVISHFLVYIGYFSIKRRVFVGCIVGIGIITMCYREGRPYVDSIKNSVVSRLEYSVVFDELQEYTTQHKDNFYYIDVDVINGGETEEVLKKDEDSLNQALMGGWLARSPWYKKKFEHYGLNGTEIDLRKENVYLIFKNKDSEEKYNLEKFLRCKDEQVSFVTEDIITTDQGIVFEVVKMNTAER